LEGRKLARAAGQLLISRDLTEVIDAGWLQASEIGDSLSGP
jgi:hypothetical protein